MLARHYAAYGCGRMANHVAFRWDGQNGLVGITYYDKTTFDDIIGYERQKKASKKTPKPSSPADPQQRPPHRPPRHGKSPPSKPSSTPTPTAACASSKSPKATSSPPDRHRLLGSRGNRYIVFLDDLSSKTRRRLQTPQNRHRRQPPDPSRQRPHLRTSNRRHLVKETWQDRPGDDELHRLDTLNEKSPSPTASASPSPSRPPTSRNTSPSSTNWPKSTKSPSAKNNSTAKPSSGNSAIPGGAAASPANSSNICLAK
jgi:hypothetical protein